MQLAARLSHNPILFKPAGKQTYRLTSLSSSPQITFKGRERFLPTTNNITSASHECNWRPSLEELQTHRRDRSVGRSRPPRCLRLHVFAIRCTKSSGSRGFHTGCRCHDPAASSINVMYSIAITPSAIAQRSRHCRTWELLQAELFFCRRRRHWRCSLPDPHGCWASAGSPPRIASHPWLPLRAATTATKLSTSQPPSPPLKRIIAAQPLCLRPYLPFGTSAIASRFTFKCLASGRVRNPPRGHWHLASTGNAYYRARMHADRKIRPRLVTSFCHFVSSRLVSSPHFVTSSRLVSSRSWLIALGAILMNSRL
jgi:hypothetical protein